MNTECIIISKVKNNDMDFFNDLLKYIEKLDVELFPVAISKMNKPYKKARKNEIVLFLYGKYHYMNKDFLRWDATKQEKEMLKQYSIVHLDHNFSKDHFTDIRIL